MVQLFTSKRRVRRVMEAGEEATPVMSRLQALGTRSTGALTSVAQRLRGKDATDYHSIQDGIAELGRINARQHDESHGCRRSERRHTDEVGHKECHKKL